VNKKTRLKLVLTGFERDTVVSIDNDRIKNSYVIASINVPSVGVGGFLGRGRYSMDIDVVVNNVLTFVDLFFKKIIQVHFISSF